MMNYKLRPLILNVEKKPIKTEDIRFIKNKNTPIVHTVSILATALINSPVFLPILSPI